mmetsp:Transcript_11320/g.47289  ORF Transcript_11320/g.47289 Transcript_11320/m.47289 type:complete len:247 (-) Transcript_11320:719-1459(-)
MHIPCPRELKRRVRAGVRHGDAWRAAPAARRVLLATPSKHLLVGLLPLAHAEIQQDLLAPTGNGVRAHLAVQALDLLALPAADVAVAAHDLRGLARAVLEDLGALHLDQRRCAAQLRVGLRMGHFVHLVCDMLEHGVRGLHLARHLSELPANDRMIDEALAECLAPVGVAEGFLQAHARESRRLGDEAPPFMVEVIHDVFEARVFVADEVLLRHLDVIECHERGAACPHAAALHLLALDAGHVLLE